MDIFHYIYRPIPRLLRYNLLLADILKSTTAVGPPNHPDIDTIPQAMEIIGDLGKATQKGVAVNESKVELWTFQHTLDGSKFGPRLIKDLDLLNPMRELIHRGRVWRQPEGAMSSSWIELQLLLFDNYRKCELLVKCAALTGSGSGQDGEALEVVAQGKEPPSLFGQPASEYRNRTSYPIVSVLTQKPIPLELLSLGNFSDAPRARSSGNKIFGSSKDETDGPSEAPSDNRTVWPFTISFIGQGQLGGQYTLWTDSYATRADWQEKLQHAKVLRAEVNDAGKVFEMTPLSQDTFFVPANYAVPKAEGESHFTGRVTCSCPFSKSTARLGISPKGMVLTARYNRRSVARSCRVRRGCMDRITPRSTITQKGLTRQTGHECCRIGGFRDLPCTAGQGRSKLVVRETQLMNRACWHIILRRLYHPMQLSRSELHLNASVRAKTSRTSRSGSCLDGHWSSTSRRRG